jgi:hypothetical protein
MRGGKLDELEIGWDGTIVFMLMMWLVTLLFRSYN